VPKVLTKLHGLLAASARSASFNDVVAVEDGARFVSADPHGYALLNAKPAEVANPAPSQIVNDQSDVLALASLFACSSTFRTQTLCVDRRGNHDLFT